LLLVLSSSALSDPGNRLANTSTPATANAYDELGMRFAAALNKKNLDDMSDMFDIIQFANITAHLVVNSPSEVNEFVKGFTSTSKSKFLHRVFSSVLNQKASAKYLRSLKNNSPLIRIDFDGGGHEYLILHTNQGVNGKLLVNDLFLLTSGKDLSATIGAATQLMLKPSASMIKRLFGRPDIDKNMLTTIKEIGRLKNNGKFREAYALIDTLPDDIKNKRVMIDFSILLSQQFSEEEYQKQLSRLDKYYGNDSTTAFILIDHYFYTQQYAKMQAALDRLIVLFGEDGALLTLKASTYLRTKDFANARLYCIKAIQTEPTFETAYWTLISVYNRQEKFTDVINTLGNIERKFGYSFTAASFKGNASYAKFIQSPEFKTKYLSK
jgi:tetratricopeptide (TPR) repeat protein